MFHVAENEELLPDSMASVLSWSKTLSSVYFIKCWMHSELTLTLIQPLLFAVILFGALHGNHLAPAYYLQPLS